MAPFGSRSLAATAASNPDSAWSPSIDTAMAPPPSLPAVMSAVSGLKVASSAINQDVVVGVACGILVLLFSAQQFGTGKASTVGWGPHYCRPTGQPGVKP